jgi:hypothetical protein
VLKVTLPGTVRLVLLLDKFTTAPALLEAAPKLLD